MRGRFLWAREDEDAGTEGGARTVALTTAQLPSHTHNGPSHTHSTPNHTHTWNNEGGTWGTVALSSSRVAFAGLRKSGVTGFSSPSSGGAFSGWDKTNIWMASSGAGTTGTGGTQATSATGGGAAHENMPPYIAASLWVRTA